MRIKPWVELGVAALCWMNALGCSVSRPAEQPPASEQRTASAPTAPPDTTPSPPECAGICYHDLPNGTCESMPTCCPRTVHLKVPPHCPADYSLDLNSGPERCAVRHLCVD